MVENLKICPLGLLSDDENRPRVPWKADCFTVLLPLSSTLSFLFYFCFFVWFFLSVFFFFLCIFLFYFFSLHGILFSLLIINLHLFVSRSFGCFVPPRLGELRLLKLVETSLNLFFFYLCLRLSAVSWDMTTSRSCSFPGTYMWHLEGASLEGASTKWETQPDCLSPFHSRRVSRPSLMAGSCRELGTHAVFRFITPSFLLPLFPCQCFVAMETVITPGGF